jgi:WD40 repeat protein
VGNVHLLFARQHPASPPDETKIALRKKTSEVIVIHPFQPIFPRKLLLGYTDAVSAVAFFPYGTRLFSGSFDGTVLVWNVNP